MQLEEIEIWKHVETKIIAPTYLKLLVEHNKEAMTKRIILDSMRDHLITPIAEKNKQEYI
jgi:hypothetical protein